MASLSLITGTFFTSLLNRLGVRPPPPEGFLLSNVVLPVSVVDADISLPVSQTSILLDVNNVFTQGDVAAPAAGALLADTGAQNAGNYNATITFGNDNNAANYPTVRIQRRDAANAVTIWDILLNTGAGSSMAPFNLRLVLAQGERLRIIQGPTAGTNTSRANIFMIPG